MLKRLVLFAALGVLAMTSGCIFFHGYTKGQPIDRSAVEKLNLKEANMVTVENTIGLPDQIVTVPNGTIYRYEYTKANTFLLLIFGHTSEQDDKLLMLFDEKGLLVDKKYQDKTRDLGWRLWPFGR